MKLSLSIKGRLLLFALCISLIPIAVITTVYYFNARDALKHQVKENLRSLVELKKQHILYFLEVAKVRTVDFSTDEFMRDSLEAIVHGSNVKSEVTLHLNEHLVSMNKMAGIGIDEDVSKTTIMQYHSDWTGSMIRDVGLPAAMRDGTWNGETALLSRDGREIPVSQEIIAHKLPNGEIEFISTIMRDLTESRRNAEEKAKLREQLCHIQRLESVGKLAGGVAHNFNNLLMVITGYGSLLQMELEKNATLSGHVRKILAAVERGAHLTQDLLAFSRKQTHLPQFVALNEIVKWSESLLLKLR